MHHYNLVNENQVYYYIEQYRSQLDEKIDKRVYVWFIYIQLNYSISIFLIPCHQEIDNYFACDLQVLYTHYMFLQAETHRILAFWVLSQTHSWCQSMYQRTLMHFYQNLSPF